MNWPRALTLQKHLGLGRRTARVIEVEKQKATLTSQEQFESEVDKAVDAGLGGMSFGCETINNLFAEEVKLSAEKHGIGAEQIESVLGEFAGNKTGIWIGIIRSLPESLTVIDALFSAYDDLIGEDAADRVYARIANA